MPCPPTIGGPPIPTSPRASRPAAPAYIPPRLPSSFSPGAAPLARGQNNEARQSVRIPDPAELLATTKEAGAVRIPSPEELGLGSADEPLDWSTVEAQLDAAGATGYALNKAGAEFMFTVQMPAGPVVGRGPTKSAAIRSAVRQVRG